MSNGPSAKRSKVVSGDSLEDDFLLEDSFNPSDNDGASSDGGEIADLGDVDPTLSDAEDVGAPEIGSPKPQQTHDKKRKTGDGAGNKKLEEKRAAKKAKVKEAMDERENFATLPSELLADRLADKQSKALPKLSAIEKDDLRITESMILDTSEVTDRTTLAGFIRSAVPTLPSTLAKPPKKPGSPRVIVVAGAALRVADLCREVKTYKTKEIDVAKLFAKHFKLQEHVEYLNKTKVGVAVGTPNRIGKLLAETESLQLTHLSHLVLDVSHLNSKNQSLMDMFECREDLFKLVLGNKDIMSRLREGRMKIVLF
ncbi:DEAD/DEAH box type DNA/RNA helicase [Pseudohyphozyma bogoriensis]|nr:DEAD/DEAH box type DNA/RNA helicase [Pseudohyphozyma bogoriensis]